MIEPEEEISNRRCFSTLTSWLVFARLQSSTRACVLNLADCTRLYNECTKIALMSHLLGERAFVRLRRAHLVRVSRRRHFGVSSTSISRYYVEKYNVQLRKGERLMLSYYSVMNDPDYWPEPHKFNPDRSVARTRRLRWAVTVPLVLELATWNALQFDRGKVGPR